MPSVLLKPASEPKKASAPPDVLKFPALDPKNEFASPFVFAAPAPTPANVLLFAKNPALLLILNTRLPAMLNCFADSVPLTVPFPEILKFAFCAELTFV